MFLKEILNRVKSWLKYKSGCNPHGYMMQDARYRYRVQDARCRIDIAFGIVYLVSCILHLYLASGILNPEI